MIYKFENKAFDVTTNSLFHMGNKRVVPLREKEARVLVMLINKHPELVSREEIKSSVWSDSYATDFTLNQTIASLRVKLESKEIIATIPKKGYKLTTEAPIFMDAEQDEMELLENSNTVPFSTPSAPRFESTQTHEKEVEIDGRKVKKASFIIELALLTGLCVISMNYIFESLDTSVHVFVIKENKFVYSESREEQILAEQYRENNVVFFDKYDDEVYACMEDGKCKSISE